MTVQKDLLIRWGVQHAPVQVDLQIVWSTSGVDQPQLNQGFISDMDNAMVEKVSGMRVYNGPPSSTNNGQRVPAGFRRPQSDITLLTYPYIMVELMTVRKAADREHRGRFPVLQYTPQGYAPYDPDLGNFAYTDEYPLPHDLTWQITVSTRSIDHDRQLQMALLEDDRLPPRGMYLVVNDTIRYATASDPVNGDTQIDQTKRLFRKIYTVTATAELFQRDINQYRAPTTLDINVGVMAPASA